jgi:aspartate 1-decarboxylase
VLLAFLKSKLHQARVTDANLNYEGSIGIDLELMTQAQLYPYEKVLVVDLENGNRLETYLIPEPAGSQTVQLNGAAARLVSVGDRVIVMAFAYVDGPPSPDWRPRVLALDEYNHVTKMTGEGLPITK